MEQTGTNSIYNWLYSKTFVDRGMCADWSIHDKGDGNPHVHLLLTMRPFNPDHSWGKKEVKDWDFVRDKTEISWLMNPIRTGGRIRKPWPSWNPYPCIRRKRNSEDWCKKPPAMETGADRCYRMEQSKNCELWRSEWAKVCNEHLPLHNQVDHRSYENRENSRFLPSMKALTQERLNKSFLPGRK